MFLDKSERILYFYVFVIIIIYFILHFIYAYLTKQSKDIKIKSKIDTYVYTTYKRATYTNGYNIIDEKNNYYFYEYNALLQLFGLQKKRYYDSLDLKEGSNIKITYYGIFFKKILDFEKI